MKPLTGGPVLPWRTGGPVDESDAIVWLLLLLLSSLLLLRRRRSSSDIECPLGRHRPSSIAMRAGTDTQEGVRRGHAPLNDWPAGDGAGRGKHADSSAMMSPPLRLASVPRTARSVSVTPGNAQCTSLSLPHPPTPSPQQCCQCCHLPRPQSQSPSPRSCPVPLPVGISASLAVSCFEQRQGNPVPGRASPACAHGS